MAGLRPPRNPVIAIVGTTGTGKSQVPSMWDPSICDHTDHHRQLAVDLALRFDGEIINADAVQMYDGLPIITNKIPLDEQKGISHHLLGCVDLHEPPWRVDKYVRMAGEIVSRSWAAIRGG